MTDDLPIDVAVERVPAHPALYVGDRRRQAQVDLRTVDGAVDGVVAYVLNSLVRRRSVDGALVASGAMSDLT